MPAAILADLPPAENLAPVGPSLEEEAAFIASERESGASTPIPPAATADKDDEKTELPPLEDLVQRIPAPARELIEELFRARFVTVKRLPKAALK